MYWCAMENRFANSPKRKVAQHVDQKECDGVCLIHQFSHGLNKHVRVQQKSGSNKVLEEQHVAQKKNQPQLRPCFSNHIQDHDRHTQAVFFTTRATLKITVECSRTPRHQMVRVVFRPDTSELFARTRASADFALLNHNTLSAQTTRKVTVGCNCFIETFTSIAHAHCGVVWLCVWLCVWVCVVVCWCVWVCGCVGVWVCVVCASVCVLFVRVAGAVVLSGHSPPSRLVSEVLSGGRCGQSGTQHLCAVSTLLFHQRVQE